PRAAIALPREEITDEERVLLRPDASPFEVGLWDVRDRRGRVIACRYVTSYAESMIDGSAIARGAGEIIDWVRCRHFALGAFRFMHSHPSDASFSGEDVRMSMVQRAAFDLLGFKEVPLEFGVLRPEGLWGRRTVKDLVKLPANMIAGRHYYPGARLAA